MVDLQYNIKHCWWEKNISLQKPLEKYARLKRKTQCQLLAENKMNWTKARFYGSEISNCGGKTLSVMVVASRAHDLIIEKTAVHEENVLQTPDSYSVDFTPLN